MRKNHQSSQKSQQIIFFLITSIIINTNIMIANIMAQASLSANKTINLAHSSMKDFFLLKKFNISIHYPKASSIKEVTWQPSPTSWIKWNYNRAFDHDTKKSGFGEIMKPTLLLPFPKTLILLFSSMLNSGQSSELFALPMRSLFSILDRNWLFTCCLRLLQIFFIH